MTDTRPPTASPREHLRQAEAQLAKGDRLAAAAAYAQAGEQRTAAKLAAEAGDHRLAAGYTLQAALGKVPRGYVGVGPTQVAELLVSEGKPEDAIFLYEITGACRAAADLATELHQPVRAAQLYERAGAWAQAAAAYRRAELAAPALAALEHEVKRLRQEARDRPGASSERALREAEEERADLLVRLGRVSEALALLAPLGPSLKLGRLYQRAGKIWEAIDAFVATQHHEEALGLLGEVGASDPLRAAQVLLRCQRPLEAAARFTALGRSAEAAQAYEAGSDPLRAARAWEAARQLDRASQTYQRAGKLGDAARCMAELGRHREAGELYARAGEHRAAAACFLRAARPFEAATALLAANDRSAAHRALLEVGIDDPHYPEAALLLAPKLLDDRQAETAVQRLRLVPPSRLGTAEGRAEHHYWEGRALEELGRSSEAIEAYSKVVAAQRDFRDAMPRLAGLQAVAALTQASVGGATAAIASLTQGLGSLPSQLGQLPASRSTAPLLAPGQLLVGRYEIEAELGHGGMGRVFRAHDRELKEKVAIKTVLSQSAVGSSEEERLLREVQISRKISHPNVVRVYDLGRFEGGIFVTMELLEGETLERLLERRRQFSLDETRSLLADVAAALDAAHDLGVVHRDLKPSNLMLTPRRLKVLDFGLARTTADTRLTRVGLVVGTPLYMAPEQVLSRPLDGRADLYALGVLAFALVTGNEPFQSDNPTTIAVDHVQTAPPDPCSRRSDLPAAWSALILRLLAKAPEQRFQSARETLAAIQALPV
jgi:tetratricopeptide (TPR) repeat protein